MATLTKDYLASDTWRTEAQALESELGYTLWTDEELKASVAATLAARPDGVDPSAGIWVFAYGSLIWNPLMDYDQCKPAMVHGYCRRFCLMTRYGRGSPQRPGLVLALDQGGHTEGRAFHLRPDNLEFELWLLWRREMLSGSYRPLWLQGEVDGAPMSLLSFAIDRDCPRYTGDIDPEQKLHMLRTGEGLIGTSMDYYLQTLACLRREGIHCGYLESLAPHLVADDGKALAP